VIVACGYKIKLYPGIFHKLTYKAFFSITDFKVKYVINFFDFIQWIIFFYCYCSLTVKKGFLGTYGNAFSFGILGKQGSAKGLVLASKLAVCLGMEVPSLSHTSFTFIFGAIFCSSKSYTAPVNFPLSLSIKICGGFSNHETCSSFSAVSFFTASFFSLFRSFAHSFWPVEVHYYYYCFQHFYILITQK